MDILCYTWFTYYVYQETPYEIEKIEKADD